MVEHLSALVFDTVAAGLPFAETARTHLDGCADCRARLDAVKNERASLMNSARFAAGLQKVAPPPVRKVPSWTTPIIGLALAASLVAIVGYRTFASQTDTTLLKGAVSVELLKDGATPVTQAKVGDRLALVVGGAGYAQAAVFVVSLKGVVTPLSAWAPVAAGARVPVGSGFDVTAGSFAVIACFDNRPESTDATLAALTNAVNLKEAASLDVAAPKLPHGVCAKTRLEVVP